MNEKKNLLAPSCGETCIHPQRIEQAQAHFPRDEAMFALADLYKVFGDSTRLRILYALDENELCVCDIASPLGMTVSAISHQLRVLKQARLVKYRREGKTVFYALADSHIHGILSQGMEHIGETVVL